MRSKRGMCEMDRKRIDSAVDRLASLFPHGEIKACSDPAQMLNEASDAIMALRRRVDDLKGLVREMRGCDLTDPDDELNKRALHALEG